MKKLIKSIIFTLLCVCLIIPFAGCSKSDNSSNFGGVVTDVKSYKDEKSSLKIVTITFNAHTDIEYYHFLILYIYSVDFETYGCETLGELLHNESFLDTARSKRGGFTMTSHYGTHKSPHPSVAYTLIYEGFDEKDTINMTDEEYEALKVSLFNNLDFSAYVGWIKF